MPRRRSTEVAPTQILDAVFAAIEESGGIAADEGESDRLPLRLDVEYDGDGHRMWIYVWPLVRDTSLPGRMYRLQTAEIPSNIEWHPNDVVLILGYEVDMDVFIGFGLGGKQGPEPSIFETVVDVSLIHRAIQDGLSFGKWINQFRYEEAMIGIRPDIFLDYAVNSYRIHDTAKKPEVYNLLSIPFFYVSAWDEAAKLSEEDRIIVRDVAKKARKRAFTRKVMNAYDNRCAVTRMKLGLVDAAHVFPFRYKGASEEVTNGIALSKTLHWAFDRGLIYLDTNYFMKVNDEKVNILGRAGLKDGIKIFREMVGDETTLIHLPNDENQRPDKKMILKGLLARKIVKLKKVR